MTLLQAAKEMWVELAAIPSREKRRCDYDWEGAIVNTARHHYECDHEYHRARIVNSDDEHGNQTWRGEWDDNVFCPKCGARLEAKS